MKRWIVLLLALAACSAPPSELRLTQAPDLPPQITSDYRLASFFVPTTWHVIARAGDVLIVSGPGTPEGNVAAARGSIGLDTTNGLSYVKNTGVGLTGWVQLSTGSSGGFVATSRTLTAGTGLTGGGDLSADRTFNVIANADGSIVANANDVQVGVLATDAQHGARGGGTQHTTVSNAATGFAPAITASNRVLLSTNGTSPTWGQVDISTAQVTGLLPVTDIALGGTNQVLWSNGSNNSWTGSPTLSGTLTTNAAGAAATLGGFVGNTATYGALYLGTTPSSSNYHFFGNAAQSILNGPGGDMHIRIGGGEFLYLTTTGLRVGDATAPTEKLEVAGTGLFTGEVKLGSALLTFQSTASSPTIGALTPAASHATTLSIVGANGNGTDKNGGDVTIKAGAPTGAGLTGTVHIQTNFGNGMTVQAADPTHWKLNLAGHTTTAGDTISTFIEVVGPDGSTLYGIPLYHL